MAKSTNNRAEFSDEVKTSLETGAGHRCSYCNKRTDWLNPSRKRINIGEAAHIAAAAEGGPRYDNRMTDDERKSFDNGIWLCRNCHKLIDASPDLYSVTLLKRMKNEVTAQNTLNDDEATKVVESQNTEVSVSLASFSIDLSPDYPRENDNLYSSEYSKNSDSGDLKIEYRSLSRTNIQKFRPLFACVTLLPEDGFDAKDFRGLFPAKQCDGINLLETDRLLHKKDGRYILPPHARELLKGSVEPTGELCRTFLDALWLLYSKSSDDYEFNIQAAALFKNASHFSGHIGRVNASRSLCIYYQCSDLKEAAKLVIDQYTQLTRPKATIT